MSDYDDYNDLQEAATGNNNAGTGYGPLAYAQQGQGGGGGGGITQAPAKTYILPDPESSWSSSFNRFPHVSKLPLYEKAALSYNQIQQQHIPNCYLAATLASMANTKAGTAVIKKMIAQKKGSITTICKNFDNEGNQGPELKLTSERWFTVSFKNDVVEVSDVLYHDDSDRDPNLMYLTTPNGDRALWGAIIEVGYAKLKGSYDNLRASKSLTLDLFLAEFSSINWELLHPGKDDVKIKKACSSAGKKPAFIATLPTAKKLTGFHGFAVISMSGSTVKLWDPMAAKVVPIEFNDLLTEIQAAAASK